ncbi:MAG: hypothetical protein RLZZ403_1002 [Pseudomonadota bacterium]|jgi:hypothetical protein
MRARIEDQIQRTVVHWIRATCPGALVFHVPNGGKRSRAEAGIFKGLGVLAGVPDLIILWPGVCAGLELKAPGKKPEPAQEQIGQQMLAMGHRWGWADDIDKALALLREWGIPTRER